MGQLPPFAAICIDLLGPIVMEGATSIEPTWRYGYYYSFAKPLGLSMPLSTPSLRSGLCSLSAQVACQGGFPLSSTPSGSSGLNSGQSSSMAPRFSPFLSTPRRLAINPRPSK